MIPLIENVRNTPKHKKDNKYGNLDDLLNRPAKLNEYKNEIIQFKPSAFIAGSNERPTLGKSWEYLALSSNVVFLNENSGGSIDANPAFAKINDRIDIIDKINPEIIKNFFIWTILLFEITWDTIIEKKLNMSHTVSVILPNLKMILLRLITTLLHQLRKDKISDNK